MKDMFKGAKAGDRVFDILRGWGTVIDIPDHVNPLFTFSVEFDSGSWDWFYFDGRHRTTDLHPRLYWDKVDLPEPPSKPLPDLAVDTPILVSNGREEFKAHFYAFDADGSVLTYSFGLSSFTAQKEPVLSRWQYWRLPTPDCAEVTK